MTRNVVRREQLRTGVVECPYCGRRIAAPTDHRIVYDVVDEVTAENPDTVECSVRSDGAFAEDGTNGHGL